MSRSRSTNDTGQQTEQLFVKGGLCFRVVRGDMQDVIHIHVHVVERCQSSRVQFIRTFNISRRCVMVLAIGAGPSKANVIECLGRVRRMIPVNKPNNFL